MNIETLIDGDIDGNIEDRLARMFQTAFAPLVLESENFMFTLHPWEVWIDISGTSLVIKNGEEIVALSKSIEPVLK